MRRSILIFLFVLFAMLGCEKIDMFEETNSGVGVLAFKLNGKNIHNCASPHYFLGPIVTEIKAKINAQDSLIIESLLADNYYTEMKMSISLTELRSSNIIENPFITFTYIYRCVPAPSGINRESISVWCYDNEVKINSGRIKIRHWDEELMIISGNFECEFDAPLYSGVVEHNKVTKGNFDIKYENNLQDDEL